MQEYLNILYTIAYFTASAAAFITLLAKATGNSSRKPLPSLNRNPDREQPHSQEQWMNETRDSITPSNEQELPMELRQSEKQQQTPQPQTPNNPAPKNYLIPEPLTEEPQPQPTSEPITKNNQKRGRGRPRKTPQPEPKATEPLVVQAEQVGAEFTTRELAGTLVEDTVFVMGGMKVLVKKDQGIKVLFQKPKKTSPDQPPEPDSEPTPDEVKQSKKDILVTQ